ncbi:hypothetical protein [Streptomyces sp. NBC_01314]|uniref:hypothetical protein n=1 Tax=Streptomyces sp. NBC_01314 TaxID=2903821 RepID=UPI00308CFB4B|nr:hypothetical protein OG622_32060 [Streptomyces sp. NBC_01314]
MKLRRRTAGLLAATAVAAGSLLATSAPAQAYDPDPSGRYAQVDTGNCNRLNGDLPVEEWDSGCFLDDSHDNTFFVKDPGGIGAKAELRHGGDLIGKAEFHPDDELLYLYDTKADGDGIYARLWVEGLGLSRVYSATGASDPINRDIADGADVRVIIYDDADATDVIYSVGGRA